MFNKTKDDTKNMNILHLTPVRQLEHEIDESTGFINVLVPKFTSKIFGKFIQSRLKDKYFKADLDEFGTAAWHKIDGKRKVSNISKELLEEFGDKIQPVNHRLALFMNRLYNSGFITFLEIERK